MAEGDAQELTSDRVADLVEYMVASLVDNPDGIIIDVTDNDDNSSLIEVRVDPDDIGKVIGRHGRVIKSIRSLARACAARDNAYAEVEIIG
ncbi:MAG: KH domain-containing protein [Coriobacteriales bacterium]|nr:KH domain-containing protein [Coriobacteriales bacterium]